MRPRSLIRRTMLLVMGAELLCAVAFSGTALWHERRTRMHAFDEMLQGRSDSLLGTVQDAEDPEDNVEIDPSELRVPASDAYAVYNLNGRLLGSSANVAATLIDRQGAGFSNRFLDGKAYRVLQRDAMRVIDRAENGGVGLRRPITIVYASPTEHIRHEILEAAGFYTGFAMLLLAVTAGFLIVFLRRVLRPLEELTTQAKGVTRRSLHFDAPESALRVRELAPLAVILADTIDGLREAFEKQDHFIGDAAHELKTAIAVVRSTIQVLALRSRSPTEYAQGLEQLLQDNQRVEDLVARMLVLARMEQQVEDGAPVIELGEAVRAAASHLTTFAENRRVGVVVDIDANIWVALSAEKAEVLVSNLVVNAVQHSVNGREVNIDLKAIGSEAVLHVRDRGNGITAEAMPHVFDRFYREDYSRSRETGGAGLGLAICKSIVESAGGHISLESVHGVGTTVRVSFRLA